MREICFDSSAKSVDFYRKNQAYLEEKKPLVIDEKSMKMAISSDQWGQVNFGGIRLFLFPTWTVKDQLPYPPGFCLLPLPTGTQNSNLPKKTWEREVARSPFFPAVIERDGRRPLVVKKSENRCFLQRTG